MWIGSDKEWSWWGAFRKRGRGIAVAEGCRGIATGPDSLLPEAADSYAEYVLVSLWRQNRLAGVGSLGGDLRRWRDKMISVEIVLFQPEEFEESVDPNHLDPEAVGQTDVAYPTLLVGC